MYKRQGHSIAIYKQIARAVQLSKLKEFYEPDQGRTITLTQAFYHATKEAGSIFGKVGSFEKGYQFNALVIDTMEDSWVPLTAEERDVYKRQEKVIVTTPSADNKKEL